MRRLAAFADCFRVFLVFVNTSRGIGEAGALTPDFAEASIAIDSVFQILDRKTKIDTDDKVAEVVTLVAVVGQSGSGKSTIVGLIERFYDPSKGTVYIDGKDLKKVNLQSIRSHISLVNQEPTLFAMSIRDNIVYVKDGVTDAEIIEAAMTANAHNSLPDGYSTFPGESVLQLSESERIVQAVLDSVTLGRSTIAVAHRLTIRQAHLFAVLLDGVILEQGNHNDLIARDPAGAYYVLVYSQAGPH
nr:ABC transporter B family member 19-like [Physcomitrium patens]|eukprot:XP_024390484.1 ABC transporter B family member 19-like [Physcomitrella patens]